MPSAPARIFANASPSSPAPTRCLGEVRGHGLLLGVEVLEPDGSASPGLARSLINELREAGVLIGSEGPGGNVLKLPPADVLWPRACRPGGRGA